MTLNELLTQIKKVQPLSEEDAETGAAETLNGRRGRKAQAIEELGRLKRAYTNELMRTALFVVVVGDKREEFISLAVDNFKCFSTDPEEYFSKLVSKISPALYLGKESIANIFDIVGRHIEDSAEELGIVGYPQLIFRQEYQRTLASKEQFQSLIKQAIVNQIGGELVGIQAANSLTDTAIEKGFSAKTVPVLLPATDERFGNKISQDLERISTRVFLVRAGNTQFPAAYDLDLPEVSKEEVKKALKTISNSLKK